MARTAVVKGTRLRVTKTDSCGLPLAGNANRLVTDGFVTVTLTPELKARQDLELQNAQGQAVVSDSVPAERKWWNVALELCDVDPDLFSIIATWARVLDYDGNPIGFRDRAQVDSDTGVAFELWTGGQGDDDCLPPTDDSVFSTAAAGKNHGYLLFAGKEFVSGDIGVQMNPTTFKMNGQTFGPKRWGRGPYNVAAIDSAGTAGRLLVPAYDKDDDNHIVFFRTPVKPPEVTEGACELATTSIFTTPDFYFGGGSGEPAADVAPAQPMCDPKSYTVTVTGSAGNWKAKVGTEETANIAFDAAPSAVEAAIEALASVAAGQVEVSGAAGSYTVRLDRSLGSLTGDGAGLTGGTVTVTQI